MEDVGGRSSKYFAVAIHQAKTAIRSGNVDPRKSFGQNPGINSEQGGELEIFVCSTKKTEQMMFLKLTMNLPEWNVGEDAIQIALKRRGCSRRISRNKPSLSAEHRRLRLE